MKNINKLVLAGASVFLLQPTYSLAQDGYNFILEEIVVTGRKREESLQEVPISMSVLNKDFISDARIVTQRDLFRLVPGVHYDEGADRNAALPSVRGVQSNETATNRTKVTAFVDGMPVLGSQGSIDFNTIEQVEVYRGPQSATFGRSTFGGAVNYITKNPTDAFEGGVGVELDDFGGKILNANASGPISDSLGYSVSASYEDSESLDEYVATDGTEYGTRSGESIFGKLVFFPSDAIEAEVSISHVSTEDGPTPQYFISQAARDECFAKTGEIVTTGQGDGVYGRGMLDCDWSQGPEIVAQNDRTQNLAEDPALTAQQIEERLFLASAQSLPDSEVGTFDERDRISAEVNYILNGGSEFQVIAFYGEEQYIRGQDESFSEDGINIVPGAGADAWDVNLGGQNVVRGITSDPTDIEETYVEARWVSPESERLRYVLGASYYDYDFLTDVYRNGGYGAVLQGDAAVQRYFDLTGDLIEPAQSLSESATNIGAFFNVAYDFTDKLTASLEGRYQSDDVGGTDTLTGTSGSIKTTAFLPRFSINYNLNEQTSYYAQIAKGNNPGGVNVAYFDQDIIDSLAAANLSYDASTFENFEEETLINYELGVKGSGLDGQLQYAAALFWIDWADQAQSVNLDVGAGLDRIRTVINEGDLEMKGVEFEGTYFLNSNWTMRTALSYLDASYADYCAISIIGTGLDENPDLIELAADSGRPYDCYNVTGNTVAEQPALSLAFTPSYSADIGDSGLFWTVRTDITHEGSEYLDSANFAEKEGVTLVDVAVSLSSDYWNLALYVNNLADEDTPLAIASEDDISIPANADPEGQSNYLITPRAPRTIGLRASYNF